MLLVTKTHHERDEAKVPDRLLQDIGQVETDLNIFIFVTVWHCVQMCSVIS